MGANSAGWARIMRERLDLDMPDAAIERAIVDGVVERYRREGPPLIDGAIEADPPDRAPSSRSRSPRRPTPR